MKKINRRQLLILGVSSTLTLGLNDCLKAETESKGLKKSVYKSSNGLLELNLKARVNPVSIGGKTAYLFNYNGQVPGPRLEAKPGDTIKIHFTNNLNQPTNLHYHGLHIPPTGNQDNVFLNIPPQENITYEFRIPKNHPASLFWYHPHKHGFVAEQIFNGLAGLLVIRGELDQIPEIQAAKEEFLVLQDFAINSQGYIQPPNHMEVIRGREGSLITVNGKINPTFTIAKGGLLRLRLLNASASRFYRLSLENHSLFLIATDGGGIEKPIELTEILLAPGERVDVLVKGDKNEGKYNLLNLFYERGAMGMMGGGMMGGGMMRRRFNNSAQNYPQVLATINYQGVSSNLAIPDNLISLTKLPDTQITRRLEFTTGMMPRMGMVFAFNGQVYNPNRIDTTVKLNSVEEWELVNFDAHNLDHPFHIHTNSFQVISRNGKPETYTSWKDTVLVKSKETVRIRLAFLDFAGKTVYHCHILDHEDLGMMGVFNIKSS